MDESSAEQQIADQRTIDSAASSDVISDDQIKKTWNDTTHLHGNLWRSEYKNFRTTANAVQLKNIFNRQFHPAFTQHLQSKLTGTSSIAQAYPAEAADNSATDA
ncbi:uncharacterized protein L199_001992 [Kwoniella botswanensis]|uniref:uncharacterized protein n=1 Tax=Kwoniella botswanensis TaxID=1268659 RepID=UPI00315C7DF6